MQQIIQLERQFSDCFAASENEDSDVHGVSQKGKAQHHMVLPFFNKSNQMQQKYNIQVNHGGSTPSANCSVNQNHEREYAVDGQENIEKGCGVQEQLHMAPLSARTPRLPQEQQESASEGFVPPSNSASKVQPAKASQLTKQPKRNAREVIEDRRRRILAENRDSI